MSGGRRMCGMIGLAVALIGGVAGSAGAAIAAPAAVPGALHCTNTTSGATWNSPVDLAHGTVDQVPARITDGSISWKDATMRYYDFDRRTGLLDMHAASSTGGFYLTDRCVLK
jgi:hypothetical protein